MQHSHTPALHFAGHHHLWRNAAYLSLAGAGVIAVIEHMPGLLVPLAIAFALVIAVTDRTEKQVSAWSSKTPESASRLLGDGGSFPCAGPEQESKTSASPNVLDGGSLERHRP